MFGWIYGSIVQTRVFFWGSFRYDYGSFLISSLCLMCEPFISRLYDRILFVYNSGFRKSLDSDVCVRTIYLLKKVIQFLIRTLLWGEKHHKKQVSKFKLMRLYYDSKFVLFAMCFGSEVSLNLLEKRRILNVLFRCS